LDPWENETDSAAVAPSLEVWRSQQNFRALLQAMSRPGKLGRLEVVGLPSPVWAVAECVLDQEVSCCILGMFGDARQHAELVAITGARQAPLDEADFVFVREEGAGAAIQAAKRGRLDSPEQAATLVFCIDNSLASPVERLQVRLTGPGISEAAGIAPQMTGIAMDELRTLAQVNGDYPLGVDAIFVNSSGEVMCLPRSTRIRVR
jgi:alpha-D-ribose 1-methylphosphonate 5-triphosphate synthase subunit PhnH